jgi:RNase P protein component
MATIVGAFASSHGPLLSTPPEQWFLREQFDKQYRQHWYRGEMFDFPSLVRRRAPGFADQATDAIKRERYDACQRAIDELARRVGETRADLVVIFGNDQREIYLEQLTGAFTVYSGTIVPNHPFSERQRAKLPVGVAEAEWGHAPPDPLDYPGAPAIANRIVESLLDREFDVATSECIPSRNGDPTGIPHAFGFVYRRLLQDAPPPSVPIFTNVGEGVNRPRLRRVLKFGHAVREAIEALPDDLRVVLIASGGMTHFVVDEELDRQIIDAMLAGDEKALASFPESYFMGNTCEIKSWYALVAAMKGTGKTMRMLDYVPCYRSEAGTGSAMGFAYWE